MKGTIKTHLSLPISLSPPPHPFPGRTGGLREPILCSFVVGRAVQGRLLSWPDGTQPLPPPANTPLHLTYTHIWHLSELRIAG